MQSFLKKIYFSLLFIAPFSDLLSQTVSNDSIKYRKELVVNAPFHVSSTAGCTLEWECIDKKGVENVVTFHNDQWFYFTTSDSGSYFLNIKNQLCRDKRGIQILVIDGMPCSPSTYKYLKLHSMLSVENIYYELKNLERSHTYLISIDGLLGDYCSFEICITDSPPDYSLLQFSQNLNSKTLVKDKLFYLYWNYKSPSNDTIIGFDVYKKYANTNYKPVDKVPVKHFAFNTDTVSYQFADSLNEFGDYNYLLFANTDNERYLVNSFTFNFFPHISGFIEKSKNVFKFRSRNKDSKQIEIVIADNKSNRVFEVKRFENVYNENYAIDLSKYSNTNIKKLKLEVSYIGEENERKIFRFKIN